MDGKLMQDVHNTNWKYLIILDACRYDYFKKYSSEYLPDGCSKEVISPAVNTPRWYKKCWSGKHNDIVVISGNPFVNSFIPMRGYDASIHFDDIVDVWDWGWDDDLMVAHPKAIHRSFIRHHSMQPDKRYIIHFMQPHAPYVSVDDKYKPSSNQSPKKHRSIRQILMHCSKWLRIPNWLMWQFTHFTGTDSHTAILYHDKGWEGFMEAYRDNLEFVLPYISDLIHDIRLVDVEGEIVVTADHGERLGEYGMYGHGGLRDRYVCNVPWYEVGI